MVFTFHFISNSFVFRSGADGYTFLRYTGSALAFRALDFLYSTPPAVLLYGSSAGNRPIKVYRYPTEAGFSMLAAESQPPLVYCRARHYLVLARPEATW